jgi:mannan polymerase II complex MNN10 subunit
MYRNSWVIKADDDRFWWLDLNTFIMEPSLSLQKHLFNNLNKNTYRDINYWNPLNITHPPSNELLDPVSRSATGDNSSASIDLLLSQDCDGFNLGSFFARRSEFTERLFDIWWDPVLYEQKHMEWEHKEQDALEHIYEAQPYIRSHIAFVEQRKINSFPPGACAVEVSDEERERIKQKKSHTPLHARYHYNRSGRDFLVNMAGCEWGRDCWAEMYSYRELSNWLNRTSWERFKDGLSDLWKKLTGPRIVEFDAIQTSKGDEKS